MLVLLGTCDSSVHDVPTAEYLVRTYTPDSSAGITHQGDVAHVSFSRERVTNKVHKDPVPASTREAKPIPYYYLINHQSMRGY